MSDPLTISRTVIAGKNVAIICRLLYVISYFIRCSEVEFHGASSCELYQQSYGFEDSVSSDVLHDSRASSVMTDMSESGRHSAHPSSLTSVGREALVIKPHPYSFSQAGSRSRHSSRSESIASEIPVTSSLTGSPSTSSLDQRGGTGKAQFVASRSSCCSVPTQLPTMSPYHPNFPLSPSSSLTSSSGVPVHSDSRGAGLFQVGGVQRREETQPSITQSLVHRPGSIEDRETVAKAETFTSCECHFHPRPNSCARESQFESMGMCPIDGHHYFRPPCHNSYSPPPPPAPPSNSPFTGSSSYLPHPSPSNDSLSTGCHTLSRNSSFASQSYSQTTPSSPPSQHTVVQPHPSQYRPIIGSMDSGVFDTSVMAAIGSDPQTDSLQSSGFASKSSVFSRSGSALSKRPSFTHTSSCTGSPHTSLSSYAGTSRSNKLPARISRNGMCNSFSLGNSSCSLPISSCPHTALPASQASPPSLAAGYNRTQRAGHIGYRLGSMESASLHLIGTGRSVCKEDYTTPRNLSLSPEALATGHQMASNSLKTSSSVATLARTPPPSGNTQASHTSPCCPLDSPQPSSSPSKLSPKSISPGIRSHSSPSLPLPPSLTDVEYSLPRNNSWRGLPLASGCCPELELGKKEVDEEKSVNGNEGVSDPDAGLQMNTLQVCVEKAWFCASDNFPPSSSHRFSPSMWRRVFLPRACLSPVPHPALLPASCSSTSSRWTRRG